MMVLKKLKGHDGTEGVKKMVLKGIRVNIRE